MANKRSGGGLLFSKPWKERPWWSRSKDIVSLAIIGIILLIVMWDVARRWFGY